MSSLRFLVWVDYPTPEYFQLIHNGYVIAEVKIRLKDLQIMALMIKQVTITEDDDDCKSSVETDGGYVPHT